MNKSSALKKVMIILSALIIILIIAQTAVMFIPYYELTPAPTRKEPNPVSTQYSMMEYTWTHTEEMNKVITDEEIDIEMERINTMIENGQVEENLDELKELYSQETIDKMLNGKKMKKKDVEPAVKSVINDGLIDYALVNAFALIAIIMLIQNIKHTASKYKTTSSGAWKVLAHIFTLVWGAYAMMNFLSNTMLGRGYNGIVVTISLVIVGVALVVELVNLVLTIMTRTRYKVIEAVK